MALDTMRRYLTPDEDMSVEGAVAKTPEEADAELAGLSVSDWRDLAKPEKGPMAALDRATVAARNPVGPPTEEEMDARLAGMSLRDWRDLAKPEKGPMAALDRATFAARNPVGPPAPETRDIPIKTAPSGSDAAAPAASALPTTTADKPAGKPDSSGKGGIPAPSSEGAGGDSSERDLYLARLGAQTAAGFGGMGAGKNIDMGIADTLSERLKQVQALRAKREEQGLEQQRERATWGASNRGTLNSLLAQFKDNRVVSDALMALEPSLETTKPSDFQKASTAAIMTRPKVEGIQATTKKTGAQTTTEEAKPEVARGTLEVKRGKLAEDIRKNKAAEAIRWAALSQASKQAAAKLTEGKPEAFRKEVNDKTQALGTAVSKEYGEIGAALQEADRALLGVKGVSPDLFAKVAQATRLDTLNTPEERALFRSIGELRRAAQKAQSGLAVTEPERQEFLQTFGQNWTQSPSTLLEAIEWMRRKTRDKLNTSFATYRAQGDVGNTAIRAYEQAGGVTPNAEYLKPFSERAPKAAGTAAPAPAAQVGGMVKVRHKATGKTATVDRAKADEMLKRPDFEEVQ